MTFSEIQKLYRTKHDPAERMDLISAILQIEEADWRTVEVFVSTVLLEDTNSIVRHEAAFVLGDLREKGRIGDELGAAALQKAALSDKSPTVRHEVAEAIYCFGGTQVETTLRQLLNDEIEDVRLTAAMSLTWHSQYMAQFAK
jgi:hypothetical protein